MMMIPKVLVLAAVSFMVPSVCFAHSGNLLRAAANFLPFLAPMIAAGMAALRSYFRRRE